ncbi:MAG: hypothetical protein H0V48_05125 [Nocardioidaceae bacterium]|nr:hypothetical protein [Nocardioidaceae bacterium]
MAAWLSGVGLVVAGVSLAGATPAQADCEPPSIAQAAAQSDAVFVGTTLNPVEGEVNTFEVRASDIYQGSPGAFLEVTGGLHEDAAFLEADRQYLFFTRTSAGSWTALGCGATQPISSRVIAQTDRVLGQATPLRAPASPGSGSQSRRRPRRPLVSRLAGLSRAPRRARRHRPRTAAARACGGGRAPAACSSLEPVVSHTRDGGSGDRRPMCPCPGDEPAHRLRDHGERWAGVRLLRAIPSLEERLTASSSAPPATS